MWKVNESRNALKICQRKDEETFCGDACGVQQLHRDEEVEVLCDDSYGSAMVSPSHASAHWLCPMNVSLRSAYSMMEF